ncbi:hypothetical protein ACU8KH_03952 [Lachancea thermotolerans]
MTPRKFIRKELSIQNIISQQLEGLLAFGPGFIRKTAPSLTTVALTSPSHRALIKL